MVFYQDGAVAQKANGQSPEKWVDEIEKVFIRSEECKQCHDRHYEEWKGAREQTPDLKTFGRVDAALLHGTSLESAVFRTVLGVWLQTNPTADERKRCLSCHVPSTTVFPQYAEKIVAQVISGQAADRRHRLRVLSSDQGKHQWPAAHVQDRAGEDHARPLCRSGGESRP